MPLYQFEPYDNSRSSQSIADLMERKANAQARGVELQGQATAGGINTATHAIGQSIGDLIQYERDAPRRELLATQLQGAKLALTDQQQKMSDADAMRRIYQAAYGQLPSQQPGFVGPTERGAPEAGSLPPGMIKNADGVLTFDRNWLTQSMAKAGLGEHIAPTIAALTKSDEAIATLAKLRGEVDAQHRTAIGALGGSLEAALGGGTGAPTPEQALAAFQITAVTAIHNGLVTVEQVTPYWQRVQADPMQAMPVAREMKALAHPLPQPMPGSLDDVAQKLAADKRTATNAAPPAATPAPAQPVIEPDPTITATGTPIQSPPSQIAPAAATMPDSLPVASTPPVAQPVAPPPTAKPSPGQALLQARRELEAKPGSVEAWVMQAEKIAEAKGPLTAEGRQAVDALAMDEWKKLGKDPDSVELTNAVKRMTLALEGQRLEDLKTKNAPIDVSSYVNTTTSGRQYVDISEFQTPQAKEQARKAAEEAGIRTVNKQEAAGLRAGDVARKNFQSMMTEIEGKLPRSPDGRLLVGPGNVLKAYFQKDADLAAWGSWRTAAIQAVQALAEPGMGLRLNRSEIDLMLQNDIPQITDTLATARNRVKHFNEMLDSKEKGVLERDRTTMSTPTAAPKRVNPF